MRPSGGCVGAKYNVHPPDAVVLSAQDADRGQIWSASDPTARVIGHLGAFPHRIREVGR